MSNSSDPGPNDCAPSSAPSEIEGIENSKSSDSTNPSEERLEQTQPTRASPAQRLPETQGAKAVDLSRVRIEDLLVSNIVTKSKEPKKHAFWSTQPVPQLEDNGKIDSRSDGTAGQPIETKVVADVPNEPVLLAVELFEWSEVDVTDDSQLEQVYKLLNLNYVEDGDSMFRFDYSKEFLRWALMPPGWEPSWHVGVRVKKTGKLVAFITAIPATIRVRSDVLSMVEINFLCVHKKLRSKRLAPVLIQEITRRVNLKNIWQAVYTAGTLLPRPVSASRYYHRSLNPKKLIEVGFSRIAPRMTLARTIKLYRLADEARVHGLRRMVESDVPRAWKLWTEYTRRFDLAVQFSEQEFAHWLLPRESVIYSYVVEDRNEPRAITDMVSFYSLPSSVIDHPKHNTLNAAYSFCNVSTKTSLVDLMRDALILANREGFDVFNALDLAENKSFFDHLHFHIGDGQLHYYLYNWKCRPMECSKNCLVLL